MSRRALSWQAVSQAAPLNKNAIRCRHSYICSPRRSQSTGSGSANPIKILALESSADDTCAAIVDSERKIYSNVVIKQDDLLGKSRSNSTLILSFGNILTQTVSAEKYGGIHPYHATARHQNNMVSGALNCFEV